jgi:hypothetical protein
VELKYEDACGFKEGLAAVKLKDKWGFVNMHGEVIAPLKYDDLDFLAQGFFNGFAAVAINDKWGLIDRFGKEVIPLKYEETLSGFSEGMAAVKLNDKWGFVDSTGKEVIPPQYDDVRDFENGKAWVKKDGREFYIPKPASSIAATKNPNNNSTPVKIQAPSVPMHGQVDPEFVGAWKWEPKNDEGFTTIYNFQADGTYEFYIGNAIRPDLRWYKDVILYWRLNGNTLETYSKDWKEVARTPIEKKNDAATNKPAIIMHLKGEFRAFLSMDKKPLFAGMQSTKLNNELSKLNHYPEDGHDPTILGTWKYQYPDSKNAEYIKLNGDGSYESYHNSITPAGRTDKGKCRWTIEKGILVLICDGMPATRNTIKKINDAATGKPTLLIAEYYPYFSMENKTPWK